MHIYLILLTCTCTLYHNISRPFVYFTCTRKIRQTKKQPCGTNRMAVSFLDGATYRTRTYDPLITNEMLYQLS